MKIAVIGSGAASFASLNMIREYSHQAAVDLFDVVRKKKRSRLEHVDHRNWTSKDFDEIHKEIRGSVGITFPPPLSRLGSVIPRHEVNGKRTLWKSEEPGGLTKYWSGSVLPFVEKDFVGWPISRRSLDPYYQKIANLIGIAGKGDPLDGYFGQTFVNRPQVRITDLEQILIDAVNDDTECKGPHLFAGVNRLAVETRIDKNSSCVYCGGCFYGCFRESIFDASNAINRHLHSPKFRRLPFRVESIRTERNNTVTILTEKGEYGGYEKVFCGAGCLGSIEIILRSLKEAGASVSFTDKACFAFPIFYLKEGIPGKVPEYISVASTILGYVPTESDQQYAEAHVITVPDLLFRYYLPGVAWPYISWISNRIRARTLVVFLQIHNETASQFNATLHNGTRFVIDQVRADSSRQYAQKVAKDIGSVLSNRGFFVPPFPLIEMSASSHYIGGFDPNAGILAADVNGEIMPNVYLLDSSLFPNCPAQGPTFTIMANSARITTEALNA